MSTANTTTTVDVHPADCDGDCCRPWYETAEAGVTSHDYIGLMMLVGFLLGILAIEACALVFGTPHFNVVLGAKL